MAIYLRGYLMEVVWPMLGHCVLPAAEVVGECWRRSGSSPSSAPRLGRHELGTLGWQKVWIDVTYAVAYNATSQRKVRSIIPLAHHAGLYCEQLPLGLAPLPLLLRWGCLPAWERCS